MKQYLDIELNTSDSIQQFNDTQVKKAVSILEKYISLMQNDNRIFEKGTDLVLTGDFNDVSLKRSTLINSKIQKVDFGNAALTSSYFSDTDFSDSTFDKSNMQYCQFIQNEWKNVVILSTNLSYSNFYGVTFKNVTFDGSTVAEILFEKCHFENCKFISSMMENTVFLCCTFQDVKFSSSNIEYMELKKCKFKKVFFPMSQFAYVYGILHTLSDNKNNIMLTADNNAISLNDYLNLKESFVVYYTSVQEYFPLANFYLAENKKKFAFNCIVMGMRQAIIQRNFRMLKFFCKLAKQGNIFSYETLKKLYASIETYVSEQKFNIYEQRSFIYNIGEIRSTLLESFDEYPTAQITMQTNIDSKERDKVMQFIEYIDNEINDLCTQKISHIEIRHNSDCNFIAYICAHYNEILFLINIFLTFAKGIDYVQQKILTHQQIELNRLEIKEKKEKIKKAEERNEELEHNNVEYTVQFIIDNPTANLDETNIYL